MACTGSEFVVPRPRLCQAPVDGLGTGTHRGRRNPSDDLAGSAGGRDPGSQPLRGGALDRQDVAGSADTPSRADHHDRLAHRAPEAVPDAWDAGAVRAASVQGHGAGRPAAQRRRRRRPPHSSGCRRPHDDRRGADRELYHRGNRVSPSSDGAGQGSRQALREGRDRGRRVLRLLPQPGRGGAERDRAPPGPLVQVSRRGRGAYGSGQVQAAPLETGSFIRNGATRPTRAPASTRRRRTTTAREAAATAPTTQGRCASSAPITSTSTGTATVTRASDS